MFSNIGGKIKGLAVIITILGIIGSVCGGMVLIEEAYSSETEFYGFLVMIIGSLLSWISSLTLYGFGEIVSQLKRSNEITAEISRKMGGTSYPTNDAPATSAPTYYPTQNNMSAGEWTCSCGTVNSADANFCKYCRNQKTK